jgi:sugar phosphate isomerase/epimerase
MKYAFMSFSTPQLTLAEMLATAKQLGYAGIEPRTASRHRHEVELDASPQRRRQIRDEVARSGVVMCCITVSCKYADPSTAQQNVDETHQYIDLAREVDCRRLRVFGGQYPQSVNDEQAMESLVNSLKAVADHAAEAGVTLCIETHDAWCDPNRVAEAMRRVDHKNIAVNWDIMHTQRRGGMTMDQAHKVLQPWIRHTHVHDGTDENGKLKVVPIGQGDYDHQRVLQLLKDDGYDGFISGEWIESSNSDPEFRRTHLATELTTLRRYEQELR